MNKKILFLSVLAILLSGCRGETHYEYTSYSKELKWENETFNVLTLGDIHFGQTDLVEKHMDFMNLTITDQKANPDLIVLNGDAFTYADKIIVDKLFSFIDSYNIPWTYAFGNHDDQGYYADNYIQRLLGNNSKYKNVQFVNLEDDDVDGRSNFVINLKKNNELKYQIYLFDSHSYNYAESEYDYIKENQINWYKRMVKDTNKAINPNWSIGDDSIKSSAFMHIPLPEYRNAMENLEETKILGDINEPCCAPNINSGLFQAFVDYKSTQSVTASHDHNNNVVMLYQNIYLTYSVHATDRIYSQEDAVGGQVMRIKPDCSLEFENIIHNYNEIEN